VLPDSAFETVNQDRQYHGIVDPNTVPLQPGEVCLPYWTNSTLLWPNRATYSSSAYDFQIVGTQLDLGLDSALSNFNVNRLCSLPSSTHPVLASLPPEEMQRLKQTPAILRGQIGFAVGHLDEIFRQPLTVGALSRHGPSLSLVIPAFPSNQSDDSLSEEQPTPATVVHGPPSGSPPGTATNKSSSDVEFISMSSVSVSSVGAATVAYPTKPWIIQPSGRDWRVSLTLAQRIGADAPSSTQNLFVLPVDYYLLINSRRHEALIGHSLISFASEAGDFSLRRLQLDFTWAYGGPDGLGPPVSSATVQAWLADAEFVQLRFVPDRVAVGSYALDPFPKPVSGQ
jgi:hypothetical protein